LAAQEEVKWLFIPARRQWIAGDWVLSGGLAPTGDTTEDAWQLVSEWMDSDTGDTDDVDLAVITDNMDEVAREALIAGAKRLDCRMTSRTPTIVDIGGQSGVNFLPYYGESYELDWFRETEERRQLEVVLRGTGFIHSLFAEGTMERALLEIADIPQSEWGGLGFKTRFTRMFVIATVNTDEYTKPARKTASERGVCVYDYLVNAVYDEHADLEFLQLAQLYRNVCLRFSDCFKTWKGEYLRRKQKRPVKVLVVARTFVNAVVVVSKYNALTRIIGSQVEKRKKKKRKKKKKKPGSRT
jgi:hypothetical protein